MTPPADLLRAASPAQKRAIRAFIEEVDRRADLIAFRDRAAFATAHATAIGEVMRDFGLNKHKP